LAPLVFAETGHRAYENLSVVFPKEYAIVAVENQRATNETEIRCAERHVGADGPEDSRGARASEWIRDRRRIEQIGGDLLAVGQGTLYPVLLKPEQEGSRICSACCIVLLYDIRERMDPSYEVTP
jgi:hypothetical protein